MIRFIRERNGQLETEMHRSRYTAADRSKAIDVLRGCVVIVRHMYGPDPFSGAGNCWCGRDERSKLHDVLVDPIGAVPVQHPTPEDGS